MIPLRWHDIQEGMTVEWPFTITEDQMRRYADLTGDRNPMHWDKAAARARGFRQEVVYGGLIVGAISRMIGMHLPGPGALWHHLDIDFKNPLYPDQEARITARVTYVQAELRVLRLEIAITQAQHTIAKSQVQAGLWPDTGSLT